MLLQLLYVMRPVKPVVLSVDNMTMNAARNARIFVGRVLIIAMIPVAAAAKFENNRGDGT